MPNILIVDDEPSIVDNISFALETEGFSVISCTTGGDALAELEAVNFDLIILDIGLPDMNGFELAKRIRSSSQIPIIFLTARSNEIDRVVGLELGADDYVTKPFSPRELSARVKLFCVERDQLVHLSKLYRLKAQSCSKLMIKKCSSPTATRM
jgi:two-component system catabolic regulation response regulator CreB